MTEGEFRDWVRAQLSGLGGRLRELEARPAEGAKRWPVAEHIRGEIGFLAETLARHVKAGTVQSLAIAFVTTEGVPMSGFAVGGDTLTLAGSTSFLGLEILELQRQRAAEKEEKAA